MILAFIAGVIVGIVWLAVVLIYEIETDSVAIYKPSKGLTLLLKRIKRFYCICVVRFSFWLLKSIGLEVVIASPEEIKELKTKEK